MVLTRTDENELLTALHGGVVEEEPWRLFLFRLLARIEGSFVQLMLRAPGEPVWRPAAQVLSRNWPPDGIPPEPPRDRMRPGRVYSGAELGEAQPPAARHMRVGLAEASDLCLSVFRGEGDFSASDSALLASLAPHLSIAGRTWSRLEREKIRNALTEGELALFGGGWLLVDAQARLLDGDGQSARLVAQGRMMGRAADGRLRFLLPEAEKRLEEAVAGAEPVSPRAGWLWHDPPMQMLVMPPPEGTERAFAAARCFIRIRAFPQGQQEEERVPILSDLFRLTPSEAKFAARMADGASIKEAAHALGLTIETARNYSKRIYGKTGARGQADLIRLLSASVMEKAAISGPSEGPP
ncbi:MAG: helix-turn-helix transcriptional regulator [Sphingobium sp.]